MSEPLIAGDTIEFKEYLSTWFACCDCGSVHLFVLMIDKNKKPSLVMFADDNETIRIRNEKTIEELDFIIKKLQGFRRRRIKWTKKHSLKKKTSTKKS